MGALVPSAMALIPFLLVAGYALKLTSRGETYAMRPAERTRDLVFAAIATLYTLFLVYAGGLKFVVLSAVLYAPGTLLYLWARREQRANVFTPVETLLFAVAVVGALAGIHGLVTGWISI